MKTVSPFVLRKGDSKSMSMTHYRGGGLPPNSALVTDVCAAALRAFFSAAQRGGVRK